MIDPHNGPEAYFTEDHRRCDELWTRIESAADGGEQALAARSWAAFDAAMRRHLDLEEKILFPAIEDALGMHGGGPTQVMRYEHAQMRAVLDQMERSVKAGDLGALLDRGDTLMMLIQQHNAKEEGVLYPMAERALDGETWSALAERIAAAPG